MSTYLNFTYTDYHGIELCETNKCNEYAQYTVNYVSRLTVNIQTKNLCLLCFSHWLERYGSNNFVYIDNQ
jgi:hypothetical protein